MKNDVTGNYLSTLLKKSNNIKIITYNGNWLDKIYLPNNIASQNEKLITFEQNTIYSSMIIYAEKSITSQPNQKIYFKNTNGIWNTPADLPYTQVKAIFVKPKEYDYIIDSKTEISKAGNDAGSSYLKSLLVNYDSLNITLADGSWSASFYLPDNDPSLNSKKITLYSSAGYNSNIYHSGSSYLLTKG